MRALPRQGLIVINFPIKLRHESIITWLNICWCIVLRDTPTRGKLSSSSARKLFYRSVFNLITCRRHDVMARDGLSWICFWSPTTSLRKLHFEKRRFLSFYWIQLVEEKLSLWWAQFCPNKLERHVVSILELKSSTNWDLNIAKTCSTFMFISVTIFLILCCSSLLRSAARRTK